MLARLTPRIAALALAVTLGAPLAAGQASLVAGQSPLIVLSGYAWDGGPFSGSISLMFAVEDPGPQLIGATLFLSGDVGGQRYEQYGDPIDVSITSIESRGDSLMISGTLPGDDHARAVLVHVMGSGPDQQIRVYILTEDGMFVSGGDAQPFMS